MDPMTRALQDFQTAFRRFRDDDRKLVFRVDTEPEHLEMLAKSLRVEEWQAENRAPILIFPMAFLKPEEALTQMRLVVLEHYKQLSEGMVQSEQPLPPLEEAPNDGSPLMAFVAALQGFRKAVKAVLDEPIVCWLPTQIGKTSDWHGFVFRMLGLLPLDHVSMLLAGQHHKDLLKALDKLGEQVAVHEFGVDEDESAAYFARLMGPPAAGHAPGTPSGSAAPDVAPPPRPGPPKPDDAQIKAAAEEAGLPPMLVPGKAEELRQHVVAAARAAGAGDEGEALARQQAACNLCEQEGVLLEQALMTMVLAGYQLRFGHDQQAESDYRRAEALAGEVYALPQLSQIRLALGYLLLKAGKKPQAIEAYEQSAAAAAIDSSHLLYFEALRMAGSTYLQAGDKQGAALCWQAAVNRGEQVSSAERGVSSFRDIAGALIDLLNRSGRELEARAVQDQVVGLEAGGAS